jgi:nitrogen regulatory protein PII
MEAEAVDSHQRKLLTIIAEAFLEHQLTQMLDKLGAGGYTISDARGRGSRGVRNADWASSGNVRIEVVCGENLADSIEDYLFKHYYKDYAIIAFVTDVAVLRPEKF